MDVSIIFVNYKTKDLTINAINSVIEKTKNIEYEIFVVDNNSQDGSIEAIEQQFPDINIIKSDKNGGFGYANNLAIKQARGKYVLCLNTDTLLVNNAIKIMFDYMEQEENQDIGVCGGYLIDFHNNPTICAGRFPTLNDVFWKMGLKYIFKEQYGKYRVVLHSNEKKYLKHIDYISGADIFFRKAVLDEIGAFDENYFMYFEETDLCTRIKNAGYNIRFVEDAKIMHLEGQSLNNTLTRKKHLRKSEFYYFTKFHPKQVILIKSMYCIMYLFEWLILRNTDSKILLVDILKNNFEEI